MSTRSVLRIPLAPGKALVVIHNEGDTKIVLSVQESTGLTNTRFNLELPWSIAVRVAQFILRRAPKDPDPPEDEEITAVERPRPARG